MKNNHNYSIFIRLSCTVFVLLLSLEPVRAISNEPLSLDGSFTREGHNNPIVLSNLALTQMDPETQTHQAVSVLIPTQTYRISFTVTDLDGFDLLLIEVGLMLDEAFDDQLGDGVDDTFESARGINAQGDQLTFVYNRSKMEPSLVTDEEYLGTSSWELISSNVASLNPEEFKFDFTFDFKVSKAASVGAWALNVRICDDYRDQPINPTLDAKRIDGISMAWYGEIASLSATDLDWGNITHPTDEYSDDLKQSVILNTIANGPYQRLIKADALWDGVKTETTAIAFNDASLDATLVDDPSTKASQSFAIRVNESDLEGQGPSGNFIQLSADRKTLFTSDIKTDEQGNTQTVFAYLKLSSAFQNGSYSGQIHIGVSN